MCVSCGFTCTTVHLWRPDNNLQVLALALLYCSRQSLLACYCINQALTVPPFSGGGPVSAFCLPVGTRWDVDVHPFWDTLGYRCALLPPCWDMLGYRCVYH